jgi:hypothetical protein
MEQHRPTWDVIDSVAALRVVPVVEIDDPAAAVPLARALADAGLPIRRRPRGDVAAAGRTRHR